MTGGGAGTLPTNPALASALARHGVPNSSNVSASGARGTSGAGATARTKTSVHALTAHPSLPRVAYLSQESTLPPPVAGSPSNKKKSAASAIKQPTTILSQTLIVQQYDNSGTKSKTNGAILASLPMEDVPPKMNAFRRPRSRSTKATNLPLTLASLGQLTSITFLDREALFWQTARRQYGSLSNLQAGGALVNENGEMVLSADTDLNGVAGVMGRGLCLGLQFNSILVVVQLAETPAMEDGLTILCCLEGQRQNVGKEMRVQYTPTSAAVAITNSVLVYGCSDGAMRYHNLVPSMLYSSNTEAEAGGSKASKQIRQATIKSVRGPNGRNDPVVKIVVVDPAYHETHSRDTPLGVPSQVGNNAATESDVNTLLLCSRLLTVCSSGVAFLWDVHIAVDRASGALRDLNVLPPLVRLDGLGSLTLSPRKPLASNPQARAAGFWGKAVAAKSKDGSTEAPYSSRAAPSIFYDPHRHLLFWALPSEAPVSSVDHQGDYELESLAPGSVLATKEAEDRTFLREWAQENGGFVKVWDLDLVDGLVRSSAAASATPRPPPKMPPVSIAKLPASAVSAESPLSLAVGLCHAPISASSLACVSLSQDGSELRVNAAPFHGAYDLYDAEEGGYSASGSPIKNKRKQISARPVMPKVLFVKYSARHTVPLARGSLSPFARGSLVAASHFTPDSVAVATDRGVMVVSLAHGESWASKLNPLGGPGSKIVASIAFGEEEESGSEAIPFDVPAAPIHTIMSTGGVSNRPGVVFVENNAVYASRLGSTRSSDLVEKVDLPEPTMLCNLHGKKAPWTTTRSTRMSNFAESFQTTKCPPQLITSPSGRYLCIYWEGSKSYEIVHASSLLAREQTAAGTATASDGTGQHLTPSVDSGNEVLSFAWIGEDDNFALLRKPTNVFSSDPGSEGGDVNVESQLPTKTKSGKPQVELYKLAEVTVDAVELAAGATVAAATTVSLGSLTVRGGDRVTPAVLFGGPSLCVGSFAMSEREDPGEGIAYFYSRKSGALETNDERASAYATIGTSIPYPDQVAWDDDGRLCAASYGSRVAIYLSTESQFTLLGSVQVVAEKPPLISLKFIHGVLYCSSHSSVHAVFLGDLDKEDSVCELNAYTIATDGVPLYGTDNPDISSPTPTVSALIQPHILAYHSGGLLVSTPCGLRLLPLSHPMIRIGTLLAANLTERARKWIFAVPKSEHDNLARFLIRRGHADMAISDLSGLSLKTYIDLCMITLRTAELEHLIDAHGADLVLEIADWGRSINDAYSAFFALGLHMICQERVECAKKMIAWATESGVSELLVDAANLARYLSVSDQPEGSALMRKAMDAMDFNADGQLAVVNVK